MTETTTPYDPTSSDPPPEPTSPSQHPTITTVRRELVRVSMSSTSRVTRHATTMTPAPPAARLRPSGVLVISVPVLSEAAVNGNMSLLEKEVEESGQWKLQVERIKDADTLIPKWRLMVRHRRGLHGRHHSAEDRLTWDVSFRTEIKADGETVEEASAALNAALLATAQFVCQKERLPRADGREGWLPRPQYRAERDAMPVPAEAVAVNVTQEAP